MLNKIDALDAREIEKKRKILQRATGDTVLTMSGVSHDGVQGVLRALRERIDANRLRQRKAAQEPETWQP